MNDLKSSDIGSMQSSHLANSGKKRSVPIELGGTLPNSWNISNVLVIFCLIHFFRYRDATQNLKLLCSKTKK